MDAFHSLRNRFSRSKTVHIPDFLGPEANGDEELPSYSASELKCRDVKGQEVDDESAAKVSPHPTTRNRGKVNRSLVIYQHFEKTIVHDIVPQCPNPWCNKALDIIQQK